jgi:hypothetical protein
LPKHHHVMFKQLGGGPEKCLTHLAKRYSIMKTVQPATTADRMRVSWGEGDGMGKGDYALGHKMGLLIPNLNL